MKLSTIFRRTAIQMEKNELRKDFRAQPAITTAMLGLKLTSTEWSTAMQYLTEIGVFNWAADSWNYKILAMYFAAHMARSEGL